MKACSPETCPEANQTRSLIVPVTTRATEPKAKDGGSEIDGQPKEHHKLTKLGQILERTGFESRTCKFAGPNFAGKRGAHALEQAESMPVKGNKRRKVAHAERDGPRHVLAPEGNESNPLRTSVISRSMSIADVISILVQHGSRDITQTLDTSACSEFPTSFGGFGDIFQGNLNNGASVAIKCMGIVVDPDSNELKEYLKCAAREIHAWSKLDHRYVSKLLGLAQFRGQIAMVSPWAEHGALPGFLKRWPQHNRPRLCAQIADGLAFLREHKILHGDLKGANVLISKNYEPLLTDFGNAVLHNCSLQFTPTTAKSNFSLRWTAPELLRGAPCSFEADVYALGMTILEVITGKLPYAGLQDMAVMNSINSKRHPKRSEEHIPTTSVSGDALWSLLSRCWGFEPGSRPTAQWVQDVMELVNPEGLIPSEDRML